MLHQDLWKSCRLVPILTILLGMLVEPEILLCAQGFSNVLFVSVFGGGRVVFSYC